jgi:soluble lytic murein transglycosylase-like protein
MGTMKRRGRLAVALASLLASASPTPTSAEKIAIWRPYVVEASRRFAVPIAWIERVMAVESGGRTMWRGRPIVSRAGAMGLMQLMPATWAEMRSAHDLGSDPHTPRDNILAGTAYLRLLFERFGYPGMFAAYNAGPARYADHLARGRPLPGETRAYVAAIARAASRSGADRPARADMIFVSLQPPDPPDHEASESVSGATTAAPPRPALFAIAPRR